MEGCDAISYTWYGKLARCATDADRLQWITAHYSTASPTRLLDLFRERLGIRAENPNDLPARGCKIERRRVRVVHLLQTRLENFILQGLRLGCPHLEPCSEARPLPVHPTNSRIAQLRIS